MYPKSLVSERGIDLNQVYRHLPIALCIVGRDGRLLAVNDVHAQLADRPVESLIGVRVADLHPQGGRNVERDFSVFDAGGTVPNHELAIRGRDYMVSVSPVFDAAGKVVAISVAQTDITVQKATERRVERLNRRLKLLSTVDHLTRLFNRRWFDVALAERTAMLQRAGRDFSLILFDVDRFKSFNDLFGHLAGDDCLRRVAHVAARSVRRRSTLLARYGGEEFAALVDDPDPDAAVSVAMRIADAVRSLAIDHPATPQKRVTISCGVASTNLIRQSWDLSEGRVLTSAADKALYQAKNEGRDRVVLAAPEPPLSLAG